MPRSTRRAFAFFLALGALLAGGCGHDRTPRPNLVMIVIDDMDYEHFGFAGHPLAQTPTLDRLAEGGVVFSHGFVPMSRCRPAQASLLTGLWPHQNGVYFNVGADHIDPATSLPGRLKEVGYTCIGEGKFWEYSPRLMGFSNYTIRNYETFVREGQDHLFRFLEEHVDDGPLFVWWAPQLPHTPHNPPRRFLERIDPSEIEVPPWIEGDAERFREAERLSLAMEAWLDEGVAELVAEFQRLGLYENTLFCFLIDNGYANGLPSKGTAFDKGLRTPIVFHWAGGIAGNRTFDGLVSSVDVYATFLDYAGARPLPTCQGRSLRSAIEGRPFEPRPALYGALYLQSPAETLADAARDAYALWARTPEWKYILYLQDVRAQDDPRFKIQAHFCPYPERARGDEDLFDLRGDPYELHDLAPANRPLCARLRQEVLHWWRTTGGGPLDLPED